MYLPRIQESPSSVYQAARSSKEKSISAPASPRYMYSISSEPEGRGTGDSTPVSPDCASADRCDKSNHDTTQHPCCASLPRWSRKLQTQRFLVQKRRLPGTDMDGNRGMRSVEAKGSFGKRRRIHIGVAMVSNKAILFFFSVALFRVKKKRISNKCLQYFFPETMTWGKHFNSINKQHGNGLKSSLSDLRFRCQPRFVSDQRKEVPVVHRHTKHASNLLREVVPQRPTRWVIGCFSTSTSQH